MSRRAVPRREYHAEPAVGGIAARDRAIVDYNTAPAPRIESTVCAAATVPPRRLENELPRRQVQPMISLALPSRAARVSLGFFVVIMAGLANPRVAVADAPVVDEDAIFDRFADHCYQCHGFGESQGGFSFEELGQGDGQFTDDGDDRLHQWEAVWKNLRSETMPPSSHDERPSVEQRERLLKWITRNVFRLSPDRMDPGKVVLRRLNRSEYESTILTLTGVEIDASQWLPPDDTGHGFDTIGETLTFSPVLLERYIALSERIVGEIFSSYALINRIEKVEELEARGKREKADLKANILFNGPPPPDQDVVSRRQHVRAVIERFASRAFRRPIDRPTLDRLTHLAVDVADQPGKDYEDGIAESIKLILVSPRFLYRGEMRLADAPVQIIDDQFASAPIDDYSLASRLSYFLWGTMPDQRLLDLAAAGQLRENLDTEIDRMVETSPQFERGIENFVGQWLKVRDVDILQVDRKAILRNSDRMANTRVFNKNVRRFMQQETYTFVTELIRQDRPVHELLNADYTYLNRPLATFYGIDTDDIFGDRANGDFGDGVDPETFVRFQWPAGSHRRGVLTHGSVLLVTSNPTRTSPVKRGLFVLENLLGVPSPPAPPDVPELAESATGEMASASLREILTRHREDVACASCHQRMDPLGLAFENYNAIGQYVDATFPPREDWKQTLDDAPLPVDASGTLMTGESFDNVEQMVDILANERRQDFYRCLAEKWLVFAIGRGMTYRDTTTIDHIVAELNQRGGSARGLIGAIVRSAAFSHMRVPIESTESL